MSDLKYEVEFVAISAGDGGEKLAADLERVKKLNDEINGAAEKEQAKEPPKAVSEISKAADELVKVAPKAKKSLTELKESASDAGDEMSDAGISGARLRDALQAVKSAADGNLAGLISGSGKATAALGELGPQIAIVATALLTAFRAGSVFGDALADLLTDTKALDDLAEQVNENIKAMGQAEIDLSNLEAATKEIEAKYDRVIAKAKQVADSQREIRDASLSREEAALNLQEKRATAAAKSPAEQEAVAAEFARKRFDLQTATAIFEAGQRIKELQDEEATRQIALNKIEAELLEARRGAAEAAKQYREKMDELLKMGVSKADAVTQTAGERARAEAAQNVAQGAGEKLAPQIEALTQAIESLANKQVAEAAKRDAASLASQGAAIDLGAQSQQALKGLESALIAAQQRVVDTAGKGSNADLVAAQTDVARITAAIAAAKQTLNAATSSFGDELTEGARNIELKSKQAETQIKQAATETAGAAKAGGTAIAGAAEQFAGAAAEGTNAMTGGINKMAESVSGLSQTVATQLDAISRQIAQQLTATNQRLAQVAAQAAAAQATANTATAQIQAAR